MMLMVSIASAKTTVVYEKESTNEEESIEGIPATDSLDAYLDELETFECEGCGPRYRRLDSNGHYSYGCLQFQWATFVEKTDRYGISRASGESIYDCELQKRIARAMFLNEGAAAANHWSTSIFVRGLGLPPGF